MTIKIKRRRPLDQYFSPPDVLKWLLSTVPVITPNDTILECSSGAGAISNPLKRMGFKVVTNDIDTDLPADYHLDLCELKTWETLPQVDWLITNPPFNILSGEVLERMLRHSTKGIALFVRKTITEPTYKRQQFLHDYEDHLAHIIFCPRVSFTNDGKTDSVACDWLVWTKQPASGTVVRVVTKE